LNLLPLLPFTEKIWPALSKLAAKTIKKKLLFHEICRDLDIELYEEDFDFAYLQSLSIFLLDQEHSWAMVFELPEVRMAFRLGYPANNFADVERLLDHHLHVTIKEGPLKSLDQVPADLLGTFAKVYAEQVKENMGPSAMENLKATNDFRTEAKQQSDTMIGLLEQLTRQQQPSPDNYINRGDFQQIIDAEYQGQLDQIKKSIEENQVDTAQRNLFAFKERIWERSKDTIKFKVLNNIGYTYMMQHNFDQAISYYEQAAENDPDNAANLSNLVGLYFVRKRFDDAAPITEKLKDSHPGLAYALQLYRLEEAGTAQQVIDLPNTLKENPEALVAMINTTVKNNPDTAVRHAKQLYESNKESDNFIDIYCNVVCVAVIGEHVDFQVTETLNDENRGHLLLASELLEKQWLKYQYTEYRKYHLGVLDKQNLILTVLGYQEAALKVAEAILAQDPESYYGKKQAGVNLMLLHRYEEAAKRFASIGDEHESLFEFHTSWLLALGKTGQMAEARRIAFKQLERTDSLPEDQLRVYSTLGFLYAVNEQYADALEFIEKSERLNPDSLGILADKAKVLKKLGQEDGAKACEHNMRLLMAKGLDGQTVKDRYLASVYFNETGKYKEAGDLLETIAEKGRNHFLTWELIQAYMRSGRKAKALPICVGLRELYGASPEYTRKEVEIYYHYHDFQQAETILKQYVDQFPDDLEALLNLAGLYQKNQNLGALKAFCKADMSRFQFHIEELRRYVRLLHGQGMHDKSLQLLYEFRRLNPSLEINKLFVDYCLSEPGDRKNTQIPTQVAKDTVVTLRSDSVDFKYIVTDRPEHDLKRKDGEINLSDATYQILKGKRVGNKVALNKASSPEKWQVMQIMPLFMHAFQEAMHENTTIYAANSGYLSGQIKNVEDIERFIDGQFSQQRHFYELMAEQEKYYEAYQLPLGVYALFNRKSPIEVYEYFLAKGTGIRAATGDVNFYNQAVQLASGSTVFVPDITALLTLYKTNFHIPNGIKLIVGHSTLELIETFIAVKSQNSQADHISIGENNGEKIRMIFTVEHKQTELSRLKAFQSWVIANSETRPCKALLDHDDQQANQFKRTMGADVFEAALLSKETGAVYISDDAANRRFVQEQLGVQSIWTQPLYKTLTITGQLSEDTYNELIHLMLLLGHQHTTVDKNNIVHALHRSQYRIGGPFEAMVNVLSGYHSNEESLQIAFAVISDIWTIELSPKEQEKLTYYILMRFMTFRPVYPLVLKLYRMVALFIDGENEAFIVKHAIWQLVNDYHLPTKNPSFLMNAIGKLKNK